MSILDGIPKNEKDMAEVRGYAVKLMDNLFDAKKLPPAERKVAQMMREGMSIADIAGITKDERDAMFLIGCRHLRLGDHANARSVLDSLLIIEPTDERVIYALAATYQAEARYEIAGKLYIQFLAFDATNPQGYLRLGECLLANGELDGARGCFEAAKIQVDAGYGAPALLAYADRMIATTERRAAAA